MMIRLALLLSFLQGVAAGAEICVGQPRLIEPDMQIQETDLSTPRAREAIASLKKMLVDKPQDQVTEYGISNRLQILTGYVLRQQALEDAAKHGASSPQASSSAKAFCTWLTDKGFWYD